MPPTPDGPRRPRNGFTFAGAERALFSGEPRRNGCRFMGRLHASIIGAMLQNPRSHAIPSMLRWMLIVLVFAAPAPAEAQGLTFGGYECTTDCSGHEAGYQWAESHHITEAAQCEEMLVRSPRRTSFYEGCLTYVKDPDHGPDPDEDENQNEDIDGGDK